MLELLATEAAFGASPGIGHLIEMAAGGLRAESAGLAPMVEGGFVIG